MAPRINMRQLGKRIGVDRSTISRALNPDKAHLVALATRERIREEVARAGYTLDVTAQALRRGRSQTIGILVPDLNNDTFVHVIRRIVRSLRPSDSNVVPITPFIAESLDDHEETLRLLQIFRLRRVDAIVSLSATELDVEALRQAAFDVPVILAIRSVSGAVFPSALCDDDLGGAIVAEHFAGRGHRIVCQLRGPQAGATFKHRAAGFSRLAAERGLIEAPLRLEAQLPTTSGAKAALDQILAGPQRPTAVFAHNDALALGLMESMRERGLSCPGDLAIVGFNNTELGRVLATPLTTMDYPIAEVGDHAGFLVRTLVANPAAMWETKTFKPSLVVRASG
jgi:LacI family transcriptional regulator